MVTSYSTLVTNICDNTTQIYISIHDAAKDIKVSHTTLRKYIKTGKLLKNIYLISKEK
jgi:response regulator of citrate/malate metabolism